MSIVKVAPEGAAYQSIGGVILPTDLQTGAIVGEAVGLGPITGDASKLGEASQAPELPAAAQARHVAPVAAAKSAAPLQPKDVIRLARERAREIRAELKRHRALKRELEQLERLLKAAKTKPAPVRALRSAG